MNELTVLIDVSGVPLQLCKDHKLIRQVGAEAMKKAGAFIVHEYSAELPLADNPSPPGAIVSVLIDMSEFYCHTFSDTGEMRINIHACGHVDANIVGQEVVQKLHLERYDSRLKVIHRGGGWQTG